MSQTAFANTAARVGGVRRRRAMPAGQRFWVRRSGSPWAQAWRGLLPLLGLAALAWVALEPFAHLDIEDPVRRSVQQQLRAQSLDWVRVSASGQQVLLTGRPPRAGEAEQAMALARQAVCPTWLGPHACASHVSASFETVLPVAVEPAPSAATPAAAQPEPAAAAATPVPAPSPAPTAAPLAVAPTSEQAVAITSAASAEQAAAQLCEREMAALMRDTRIEFASASASISPQSKGLLDSLAAAAKACPGKLQVQGHTDNVGHPRDNLELSMARAKAVVDALAARGVDPQRLQAQGFGPHQPLASNSSAAGRTQNRRIEFRAVPGP